MSARILLCGENGAGKSTLGRELARRLVCPFLDIEDYYFPKQNADDPYESPRTKEAAAALLLADIKKYDRLVFAAVKGDYGAEIVALLSRAVLLCVPRDIRMARVRERSFQRFGARMLPGGELYEREKRFFDMVEHRAPTGAEDWLKTTGIPWLRVDGTKSAAYNAEIIAGRLKDESWGKE